MHSPELAPPCPAGADKAPPDRMHIYRDGFLFASAGAELRTCRHAGSLLIALGEPGFELEIAGTLGNHRAVVVRPFMAKRLLARGVPFACLDVSAPHPMFRHLSLLPGPGWQALDAQRLRPVLPALQAFLDGTLDDLISRRLYMRILKHAAAMLPEPPPPDARVQRVLAQIERAPGSSFEELAETACLSVDRLSHLFSQDMGLPLRKHLQSMKVRAAARLYGRGMTLTEIAAAAGFCDSAHFSKAWMQCYGTPPGQYFMYGTARIFPMPHTLSRYASEPQALAQPQQRGQPEGSEQHRSQAVHQLHRDALRNAAA